MHITISFNFEKFFAIFDLYNLSHIIINEILY